MAAHATNELGSNNVNNFILKKSMITDLIYYLQSEDVFEQVCNVKQFYCCAKYSITIIFRHSFLYDSTDNLS